MTDNEILFDLQNRFINGDRSAIAEMYKKLFEVACKYVSTYARENKRIKNASKNERRAYAHDATTQIIEHYLKDKSFRITKSITAYLYKCVNYEVTKRGRVRKCDKMLEFTDELPERATKKNYAYLVTNTETGEKMRFVNATELFINPRFEKLRKDRLVECINTGAKWRKYTFDLLEEN